MRARGLLSPPAGNALRFEGRLPSPIGISAKSILVLCLLLTASRAVASEPAWYLAVQTYSFHEYTSDEKLQNTTPGIGLIRRQGDWLAGGGIFRNSIGRWAGYAYGGWQRPVGPVRVGGIAGVTHHYHANDGGPVPLAAALVSLPITPNVMIELVGIPRVKNFTYTTLNVSVAWRFK